MASKKQTVQTETPRAGGGRPGLLTEQIVTRVSKAMRARINRFRRDRYLDNEADAVRVALREFFDREYEQ